MKINKKLLLLSAIVASVYAIVIPIIVCEVENLNFFLVVILGLLTAFNTGGYYGVIMLYNTTFAKGLYLFGSFFLTWFIFYVLLRRYLNKKNLQ